MGDKWQNVINTVIGPGFSTNITSDGLHERMMSFLKRPNTNEASNPFSIDYNTDIISLVGHGFNTGDSIELSTTGTLPPASGITLTPLTEYYVHKEDNNTFKLSTTWYNCKNSIYIDFTGYGTGTHSVYKKGGGAGWYLLDDYSPAECKAVTFIGTAVNVANNSIQINNHRFYHGQSVIASLTASGMTAGTSYYISVIDANNIKVTSYQLSSTSGVLANVPVYTTLSQSGNTLTPADYRMFFSDTSNGQVHDVTTGPNGGPPKYVSIGYRISGLGYMGILTHLFYDSTARRMKGVFAGSLLNTSVGEFTYYFGGGETGLIFATKPTTTWGYCLVSELEPVDNVQDYTTVVTTTKTSVVAGTNKVIELNTGKASLFKVDHFYFTVDIRAAVLSGVVNYFKVTAVDTVLDTITVDTLTYNVAAGSIIGSYPHLWGLTTNGNSDGYPNLFANYNNYMQLPYVATRPTDTCAWDISVGSGSLNTICGYCDSILLGSINSLVGITKTESLVQKAAFYFYAKAASGSSITDKSVAGKSKGNHLFGSSQVSTSAFANYITVDGKDYICLTGAAAKTLIYFFRHSVSYS